MHSELLIYYFFFGIALVAVGAIAAARYIFASRKQIEAIRPLASARILELLAVLEKSHRNARYGLSAVFFGAMFLWLATFPTIFK